MYGWLRISLLIGLWLLVLVRPWPVLAGEPGQGSLIFRNLRVPKEVCAFIGDCDGGSDASEYKPEQLSGTSFHVAVNASAMDLLSPKDDKPLVCGAAFNCSGFSGKDANVSCLVRGPKAGPETREMVPHEMHVAELQKYMGKGVDLSKLGGVMKVDLCEVAKRRGERSLVSDKRILQLQNTMTVTIQDNEKPFGETCSLDPVFNDASECGQIFMSTKAYECYKHGELVRRWYFKQWNAPDEKEVASLAAKIYGRTPSFSSLVASDDCRKFAGFVRFDGDKALLNAMPKGEMSAQGAPGSPTVSSQARVAKTAPR